MNKLNLKFASQKLTKEQMKKVGGGMVAAWCTVSCSYGNGGTDRFTDDHCPNDDSYCDDFDGNTGFIFDCDCSYSSPNP